MKKYKIINWNTTLRYYTYAVLVKLMHEIGVPLYESKPFWSCTFFSAVKRTWMLELATYCTAYKAWHTTTLFSRMQIYQHSPMHNENNSVQVFTNLATEVSSSTSVLSKGRLSIRVGDCPLGTLQCIPAAQASSFERTFLNTLYLSL